MIRRRGVLACVIDTVIENMRRHERDFREERRCNGDRWQAK